LQVGARHAFLDAVGPLVAAPRNTHELQMPAFEAPERVLDFEVEAQRLHDQILGRENVFGGHFLKVCGEGLDGLVCVFGLAGEEHGGAGDVLAVVRHGRVVEVEATQELDACCLWALSVLGVPQTAS
jgi:hypothetical protein